MVERISFHIAAFLLSFSSVVMVLRFRSLYCLGSASFFLSVSYNSIRSQYFILAFGLMLFLSFSHSFLFVRHTRTRFRNLAVPVHVSTEEKKRHTLTHFTKAKRNVTKTKSSFFASKIIIVITISHNM